MKNTIKIILTLMLIISFGCNLTAQKVLTVKADQMSAKTNPESNYSKWSEFEETDLLIQLTDEKITIDNKFEDVFYIRTVKNEGVHYDSDGDKYTAFLYRVYDNQGKQPEIMVTLYHDMNLVSITVFYIDIHYSYWGKLIE